MNQLLLLCFVLPLCAHRLLADEVHQHFDRSEKLGTLSFPISCAPATQKPFERGVALMHSFWYGESEKQFKALEQEDPSCAMAYWGEAMSLLRQLVNIPEQPDLKRGLELIQRARAIGGVLPRSDAGDYSSLDVAQSAIFHPCYFCSRSHRHPYHRHLEHVTFYCPDGRALRN